MLRGSFTADRLLHRRLEYLGTPNYIALFCVSGFIFLYCAKFVILPKCKKLHHFVTKKRVEGTLDQIDGVEFEEMLERTMPRIDPETGEVYMGTGPEDKVTETEAMMRMLRDIKEEEDGQKRAEEEKQDAPVIGPDGKPLLEHQAFDAFGNVIGEEVKEGSEEREEGTGSRPTSAKKVKKKAQPKILSPKKLAAIEKKRKEDEAFRIAYKKSLTIPDVEDRVTVVKEEFEKYLLHGKEPLGYQLSLEKRKELERTADKTTFHLLPPSNYFHRLVEKEKIEQTRHKYRKVKLTRPKSASADFNMTSGATVEYIYGRGRNDMGFDGHPRKPSGPPLKSEGKRLEDGDARDKGVIVRGFGSLPTRGAILDPLTRSQKREKDADRAEYFAKDGSGRPASPHEVREYQAERANRSARGRASSPSAGLRGGSLSPDARSRSPAAREDSVSPPRPRPMTAAQFRRSYY